MTYQLTAAKKLCGILGLGVLVLGSAACTKTVDGAATAAPVTKKSTEGEVVQAPDESYVFDSGTVIKLTGAQEDNEISGLLSNEVGRILAFTVENESDEELDLSDTQADADVDCEGNNQYVFPSKDFGGPDTLPAGDTAEYTLHMGLKKDDVGMSCTITFPITTGDGPADSVATFEMVL